MTNKLNIFSVIFTVLAIICETTLVRSGNSSPPYERAKLILEEMTLDEKISMLHGASGSNYVGFIPEVSRLGIPALKMSDGPQGFRDDNHPGTTTAWPSGLSLGASWDFELCYQWGAAMGKEFYGKGANVQLGPGLNLHRVPTNGRNFEYLSGGDPYLGFSLVKPVVQGIQSQKIIANAKHWIHNNQEIDRDTVSANVDERTRFELYYQPFIGAIEAGVGSFMCSYNKINLDWSCENNQTLNADLKKTLNFTGWVMSDWGATHSTSIDKGLDQEMPGGDYFGDKLKDLINDGTMPINTLNDSVMRILVQMFTLGLFDEVNSNSLSNNVTSEEHVTLARQISAASHVLLANDGILPLKKDTKTKIAIFGKAAFEPVVVGGGSGAVLPAYVISPYRGILDAVGLKYNPSEEITCSLTGNQTSYHQWGCQSAPATSAENCADLCAKQYNCHYFAYSGGRCNFYPTNDEARPSEDEIITGECTKPFPSSSWQCNENGLTCVAFASGDDLEVVKKLSAEADVGLIVISQFAKEGDDRSDLSFAASSGQTCQVVPKSQDELVTTVASTGLRSIVAATAPGAVLMPWRSQVSAIFHGFMPGQEYGHALADLLFGDVNPSAKLPLTMPNVDNEIGFSKLQYPGIAKETVYSERMLIDYRWYTANNVTPAFPFGHGLSYTSFKYSDMKIVNESSIGVTVTNTGSYSGRDVVQLYLEFPKEAETAPLQLKGFVKTKLIQPGFSEIISFELKARDFSIWSTIDHNWRILPGRYGVKVGSSSSYEDLMLSGHIDIL